MQIDFGGHNSKDPLLNIINNNLLTPFDIGLQEEENSHGYVVKRLKWVSEFSLYSESRAKN